MRKREGWDLKNYFDLVWILQFTLLNKQRDYIEENPFAVLCISFWE